MNLLPLVLRLVVNYIVIYDFGDSLSNVIHPTNPFHLIICLELFGHALTFCHFFSQAIKCILDYLYLDMLRPDLQ